MHKDHQSVWQDCLQHIAPEVPPQGFKTWFLPIKSLKYTDETLTIQVPSAFFYDWLEEHYLNLLNKAIKRVIGPEGKLEYAVRMQKSPAPSHGKQLKAKQEVIPPFVNGAIQVNEDHTFDNFVAGTSNVLPKSAAQAIAEQPGKTSFNPCLFYGATGTGKTHLSQAILHGLSPLNFQARYLSAEDFTSQFVAALRKNYVQDFIDYYLRLDVLILDDVQFFAGKEKTQEIFFYIFKHYHQQHKQLVMTSDRSPRELQGLHQRLLSRFKWGLSVDLQPPDFETRLAIIQKKFRATSLEISEELQEYIAAHVTTNVRELEGVIKSIIGHTTLTGKEPNPSLVKKIIEDIVCTFQQNSLGIDFILKTVADYYNLDPKVIQGKLRKKEVANARHLAMYLTKKYDTRRSLKSIGDYFDGRDHTSVIYALQAVNNLIDTDKRVRASLKELERRITRATLGG